MLRYEFDPMAEEHQFVECPVCLLPWCEPRELKPCGHIFCARCVGAAPVCPVCRSPVASAELPNRVLLNVLSNLKGRCSFCPPSSWSGSRDQFLAHAAACHPGQQLFPPTHASGVLPAQDGAVGAPQRPSSECSPVAVDLSSSDPFASIPVWEDYNMRRDEFDGVCTSFFQLVEQRRHDKSTSGPSSSSSSSAVMISEADVMALTLHLNLHFPHPTNASARHGLFDYFGIPRRMDAPSSSSSSSSLARPAGQAAASIGSSCDAGAELYQVLTWIAVASVGRDLVKEYGASTASRYADVLKTFRRVDDHVNGVVRSVAQAKQVADAATGQSMSLPDVSRIFLCAKQATLLSSQGSRALLGVVQDGASLHELLIAVESAGDGWDLTTEGTTPLDGASKKTPLGQQQATSSLKQVLVATAPPATPPGSTVRDRPGMQPVATFHPPEQQPSFRDQYKPVIVHQTAQQPNYGGAYPGMPPQQQPYPMVVPGPQYYDPNRPTTAGYLHQPPMPQQYPPQQPPYYGMPQQQPQQYQQQQQQPSSSRRKTCQQQ